MNHARSRFSGVVHKNKIIVFGGFEQRETNTSLTTEEVETYDPLSNVWTLTKWRKALGFKHFLEVNVISIEDQIIMFGGADGKSESSNGVFSHDTVKNKITSVTTMNFGRSSALLQ